MARRLLIPVASPSAQPRNSATTPTAPALSADGRYLVFASEDPALSDEDVTSLGGSPAITSAEPRHLRLRPDVRSDGPRLAAQRRHGRSRRRRLEPALDLADGRYVAFGTEAEQPRRGRRTSSAAPTCATCGAEANDTRLRRPGTESGERLVHAFDLRVGRWRLRLRIRTPFNREHPLKPSAAGNRAATNAIMFASGGAMRTVAGDLRANGRHGAVADEDCREPVDLVRRALRRLLLEGDEPGSRRRPHGVEDVFVRDLTRGGRSSSRPPLGPGRGARGSGDSGRALDLCRRALRRLPVARRQPCARVTARRARCLRQGPAHRA